MYKELQLLLIYCIRTKDYRIVEEEEKKKLNKSTCRANQESDIS